MSEGQPCLTI